MPARAACSRLKLVRGAKAVFCVLLAAACGSESGQDAGLPDFGFLPDSGVVSGADTGPSITILVTSVIDGDTIRVAAGAGVKTPDNRNPGETNIRLLGIDAPEIAHPPTPADCWGDDAKDAAHNLLQARHVTLDYDETRNVRDDFGRLLAYVILDDQRVANEVLIQTGNARSFRSFPHRDTQKYNQLETQAKNANLGMWTCPR